MIEKGPQNLNESDDLKMVKMSRWVSNLTEKLACRLPTFTLPTRQQFVVVNFT